MALDSKPIGFLCSKNKLKHKNIVFLLMAEMGTWVLCSKPQYYWTDTMQIASLGGEEREDMTLIVNETTCSIPLLILFQQVILSSGSEFFHSSLLFPSQILLNGRKTRNHLFQLIAFRYPSNEAAESQCFGELLMETTFLYCVRNTLLS